MHETSEKARVPEYADVESIPFDPNAVVASADVPGTARWIVPRGKESTDTRAGGTMHVFVEHGRRGHLRAVHVEAITSDGADTFVVTGTSRALGMKRDETDIAARAESIGVTGKSQTPIRLVVRYPRESMPLLVDRVAYKAKSTENPFSDKALEENPGIAATIAARVDERSETALGLLKRVFLGK